MINTQHKIVTEYLSNHIPLGFHLLEQKYNATTRSREQAPKSLAHRAISTNLKRSLNNNAPKISDNHDIVMSTDLHVQQLNGSTIGSRQHIQNIHSSAIAEPRRPILEEFCNLEGTWLSNFKGQTQNEGENVAGYKDKQTYPCRFKTHKAASTCCHSRATMRNSNDSYGIRTRLFKSKRDQENGLKVKSQKIYILTQSSKRIKNMYYGSQGSSFG